MSNTALGPRVKDLETKTTDHERRINIIAQWRDGNGADGAEKRLQRLEKDNRDGDCCVGKDLIEHLEEHKEVMKTLNETKSWKVPLIVLGLMQFAGLVMMMVSLLM